MKLLSWILVMVLAFASLEVEAARLGGGRSIGRQSGNVTQRQVAPRPPAAVPNQQQAAPQPAPAPATAAPRRPWGAMLGGLAAGLGLAWLAHSLGLGAGFANILLIALLAMVVLGAIAAMRRPRPAPGGSSYAYGGTGATAETPISPRQYSPDKVGNDASARPWERSSMAFEAPKQDGGVQIGSALAGSQTWGIPAGFDTDGFLAAAKRNFVTLQDAWDRGDLSTLRSMMTDEMLGEIKAQIADRERQGSPRTRTEVEMLQASLLGIEETADDYLASVEFSGMIREDPSAGPSSFREVWNMSKPKTGGSGWLVAGVQALQ